MQKIARAARDSLVRNITDILRNRERGCNNSDKNYTRRDCAAIVWVDRIFGLQFDLLNYCCRDRCTRLLLTVRARTYARRNQLKILYMSLVQEGGVDNLKHITKSHFRSWRDTETQKYHFRVIFRRKTSNVFGEIEKPLFP